MNLKIFLGGFVQIIVVFIASNIANTNPPYWNSHFIQLLITFETLQG